MALMPQIQQRIAGACIEAQYGGAIQQRDICDAADIDDGFGAMILGKYRLMKRGNEWCTLTFGCDVAAAKVCDGSNACQLCDTVGIADLQREAVAMIGSMINRLAVAADGLNVRRRRM